VQSLPVILVIGLGLLCSLQARAQIVEIIDETGDVNTFGDTLDQPWHFALGPGGDLFIADEEVGHIFQIDPAGAISTLTPLELVYDVVVHADGTLYATSAGFNRVYEVTPEGTATQLAQIPPGSGFATLVLNVAVDSAHNVYVAGQSFFLVDDYTLKIAPDGSMTPYIDANGDGMGNTFSGAVGVAVDSEDNVYVSGIGSNNVFKVTPSGTISEIIDSSGDGAGNGLASPTGVAVGPEGSIYVSGSDNAFEIAPSGTITQIIDAAGDQMGQALEGSTSIAVDPGGNVYVAGATSDNAFRITPNGTITQIIDSAGDGQGNPLSFPFDVAVSNEGRVYVLGLGSKNAFEINMPNVPLLSLGGIAMLISAFGIAGFRSLARRAT